MMAEIVNFLTGSLYPDLVQYVQILISVYIAAIVFFSRVRRTSYVTFIGVSCLLDLIIGLITGSAALHSLYLVAQLVTIFLVYSASLSSPHVALLRALFVALISVAAFGIFIASGRGTSPFAFARILSFIGIGSLSLVYFYFLLSKLPTTHIHNLPMFWFNGGIFIYYIGMLSVYTIAEGMEASLENTYLIDRLFDRSLGTVKQILILIGILKWKTGGE